MVTPLLCMLVTSIETVPETRRFPPVIVPAGVHYQNYSSVLTEAPFGRWFLNTLIVTTACVIGNLVFCSLAGYAFARLRFAGKNLAFFLLPGDADDPVPGDDDPDVPDHPLGRADRHAAAR